MSSEKELHINLGVASHFCPHKANEVTVLATFSGFLQREDNCPTHGRVRMTSTVLSQEGKSLTKRPFFPQSTKGKALLKQDTLRSDPAGPFPGLVCSCIPGSCVIDYSNSCGSCSSSELDAPLRHRPICSFTDISQHKGCFFMRRQRISTKASLERLRE